jgi:hypothetical protein
MSKSNNSRPTSPRTPNRGMSGSQSHVCLWRLSGRYSAYRGGLDRGWMKSRPQQFVQASEAEPTKADPDTIHG